MKKKLISICCALALLLAAAVPASALSGEETRAADTLYTLGLVRGFGSGDYDLSADATRAQTAALLIRLAGAESAAAADNWISGFRDVPAWVEDAVNYASHQGWVSGTTDVTFSPSRAVTANAACAFLLRMLGYSDAKGEFSVSGAALFAQHIGLTTQLYEGTLSRGELFELAASALTFSYKDGSGTVIGRLVSGGSVSRASANALGLLTQTLTARQAADRSTAAVFQLNCYENQTYIDAGTPSATASGFFLSADGVAVTNYHSIDGAIQASVTLSTGESYPVEKVLWYDTGEDLAVLRISMTSDKGVKTSAFACLNAVSSSDLRRGDAVYAIGSPLGQGLSISSGIVSDTARTIERYTLPCIMDTADISQGSSGGALLNVFGQVIGVTSGAYVYGNNMYLAVPIDPVLKADLSGEGWTLAQVAAKEAASAAA